MLQRPNLSDDQISACLRKGYGQQVVSIEFLPLGYDSNAAVFRVAAAGGEIRFLKLRRGAVNQASLSVPRYLKDAGIDQIVPPLPARDGSLWQSGGDHALILYPFVEGGLGAEVGLSDAQWLQLGSVLGRIHALDLPATLRAQLKQETFVPKWAAGVKALAERVRSGAVGTDSLAAALARFWRGREAEIDGLVRRAEALGHLLQRRPVQHVLCHADFHTYNILVDDDGRLFVVDWDETLLAPKERDLMFVVDAAVGGLAIGQRAEDLFLRGYGDAAIDWLALAYYRYEWVVQELGEFGALVFSRNDVGDEMRQAGLHGFQGIFRPGNVVEAAYRSQRMLPPVMQEGERRWL